jgi:hypothetical protein
MSASDWLVLAQTIILAVTIIPAMLALKASASVRRREGRASRTRDDLARLDRVADQVARLSEVTGDAQQGRVPVEKMEAERRRLQALLAPFGKFKLEALKTYALDDPTHATPEHIDAALDEVTELSQTLRDLLDEVLEPPSHPWWQVWRL